MNPVSDAPIARAASAADLVQAAADNPAVAAELNALFGQSGSGPYAGLVASLLTAVVAHYGLHLSPELMAGLVGLAGAAAAKIWSLVARRMGKAAVVAP